MDDIEEGKRQKRSTRYSGDFQVTFGDANSSDDDVKDLKKKVGSAMKQKKSKDCPGCGAVLPLACRECRLCDYQFTSKSMTVSNQSQTLESTQIREKFLFEPDRDEDGSLLIQIILGRRARKTGRRSGAALLADMSAMDAKYEYEYLIKYKSLSYLHVQWLSANDIEAMSQKSKAALQRYLTKLDKGDSTVADDCDIDPSYTEVEKVLDYREEEVHEVVDDLNPPSNNYKDTSAAEDATNEDAAVEEDTAKATSSAAKPAAVTAAPVPSLQVDKEEVAISNNRIFQPVERCKKVLEKIWEDPYSLSFQDPVDTSLYDDYLDVVEEPMCLKDIKQKLDTGEYSKYGSYARFAGDMRKIWRNCKLYNLYKSQIWHSANALSMMFERLYQAWVVSYSDGLISMTDPIGTPWESSCRLCLEEINDEQMMLCDHCDAAHHIYCLEPPLEKVPEEAWMCPRCIAWFAKTGSKMLSASAEEEARQQVDGAANRKVVKVKKKKYLVKWRGLSYRECTWETAKDINDDAKIAEYHQLNDSPPDEPPLTQAEIGLELAKDRKMQLNPAGINMGRGNPVADLDAQIYAQIRSYHFLKWNKIVPGALLRESGPAAYAYYSGTRSVMAVPKSALTVIQKAISWKALPDPEEEMDVCKDAEGHAEKKDQLEGSSEEKNGQNGEDDDEETPKFNKSLTWYLPQQDSNAEIDSSRVIENSLDYTRSTVAEILSEAIYSVARDHEKVPISAYPSRPPLPSRYQIPSEIEVCVPKGGHSLYMKVACFQNKVIVAGFKPVDESTGKKGPVEATGRVKVGDVLIAINGFYVHHLKYSNIVTLLNRNQPYLYLRFLRIPACLEARMSGSVTDYLDKKMRFTSLKRYPIRSLFKGVYPFGLKDLAAAASTVKGEVAATSGGEAMDEEKISSDEKKPESESVKATASSLDFDSNRIQWVAEYVKDYAIVRIGLFDDEVTAARAYDAAVKSTMKDSSEKESLLLNFKDNGEPSANALPLYKEVSKERRYNKSVCEYDSSDECEPSALKENVEDLDDFRSEDSRDSNSFLGPAMDSDSSSSSSDSDLNEEDEDDDKDSDDNKSQVDNDWDSTNEDVDWVPNKEKDNYDNDGPVSRLIRAVNESDYAPLKSDWSRYIIELGIAKETTVVRSKQIEQVELATGVCIRSWDSISAASKTLNIPFSDIHKAIVNVGDGIAGGFKWRQVIKESTQTVDQEDDDIIDDDDAAAAEESWKSKLPTKSQEYKSGGTLRDYQVEGLSWLLRCWYTKRSSILADEMGLGKTVQVVTFLDHLFTVENIKGPFLICVPLSTIGHWKREFESWTHMTCCIYHDVGGGRDMRDVIREYEWYYKGRSRRVLKFHVLITTYDDLVRDYEELAEIPWRVVIVDEAHRLRNVNSKLLECMRSVVTKGLISYGYQHRVLMTGTPLQNNTMELWSLLNFIEPAKFPDLEKFQERFGDIKTQEQVETLQRRIAPHLLRRVKEDVAKDIPPKAETIIDVELTTMQKQYYRAIFERNHGFLMQNLKGNLPKLMNIQMELRKCCNHPFLIHGVEQMEMENLDKILDEEKQQSKSVKSNLTLKQAALIEKREYEKRRMEEFLIPASGKLVLLDKLLPKLQREGHKVLIFSQMVKMIDIIDEYCDMRKYPCERLDGRVSGNDRQKAIDRYHKDPNSFVFLLSTRAGGVGINLTAADTVIIFDSDWNPQNDVQAMARCHRIGQSKNVTIYRLITRRSFESEMFQRASKKLGLEQAVLGTRNFNDIDQDENAKNNAKVDAKEMEQLLREGAYAVLLEDDTDAVKEFYEQDIDKILEQRSHVIVTESGGAQNKGTESWLNKRKKTGRTSKSMFTGDSAKEHAEIDVNDPDFWKKVLPDLVTPDLMLERIREVDDADDDDEVLEKYMKDLSQMMDGMLDLNRRNQLPERERAVCMKLLLRITLKTKSFGEDDRMKAQEWLSFMEGTRVRRSRQDVYSGENFKAGSKPISKTVKKLRGRAAALAKLQQQKLLLASKSKGKKRSQAGDEDADADDDEDADEEAEDDDDDDDDRSSGDDKSQKKSSKTLSKQEKSAAKKKAKEEANAVKRKYTFKNREPKAVKPPTEKRKYVRKNLTSDEKEEGEGRSDDAEGEGGTGLVLKLKRRRLSKNSGKGDDEEAVDDEIVEEESVDAEGTDGAVDEKSTRKPPRQRDLPTTKNIVTSEGVEMEVDPPPVSTPSKRGRKPGFKVVKATESAKKVTKQPDESTSSAVEASQKAGEEEEDEEGGMEQVDSEADGIDDDDEGDLGEGDDDDIGNGEQFL